MERLEKIVRQIDNNELDIDILSEKIKEANEIIAFCKDKLTKADREVEKLLQEKRLSEEYARIRRGCARSTSPAPALS